MNAVRSSCTIVLLCTLSVFFVPLTQAQNQGGPPGVPSKWSVKEMATFPEIRWPSVVETAPDGRVFVAEDPQDMMGPVGEPLGRIVCFHPDGRKTVVEEDLFAVFGLLFIDGKLYVNHPPKLTLLEVEGGKATDRKTLIERLGKDPWQWGFNDHIPSQLKLGMDGYIYMSVGDKGIHRAEGTDGSTATLHGGGLLRFRPGATDLEVYSTGTRNHLDVAVNSQDEMFVYDNDGGANVYETRVMHLVDGGYYGYPYEVNPTPPYVLPKIESYGGGSPTGGVAYTGARLPKTFHENLFMCEWGKRAVVRFDVSRSGSTFRIDQRERFFSGGDDEFRPVGITMAQDGVSFYVTDWNFSGWKAGKKRGQLFKMTYTGETRDVSIPDWYGKAGNGDEVDVPTDRLIKDGLKHPAKRVRMVAQRRLADRGKQAIPPIARMIKSNQATPRAKWHGVWTLDAIDGGRARRNLMINLTKQNNPPSVRRQAMRQLGTREAGGATKLLIEHLDDRDASIRFYASTALGRIGAPRAVKPLLRALDEEDVFARYATFNALNRIGRSHPEAWRDIAEGLGNENKRIRTGTRFAMRETYVVENVEALSDVVLNGSTGKAREEAIRLLVPLLKKRPQWGGGWWATSPADEKPRPRSMKWEGTSIVRSTLKKVATGDSTALKTTMLERMTELPHDNIPSSLVSTLLTLYEHQDTRESARDALISVRDERALDVYLDGLTSDEKQVRKESRKALSVISSEVREEVFRKVRQSSLPDDVVKQLAVVYSEPVPIRDWHVLGPFERDRSLPFDPRDVSYDRSFEGKNGEVSWTKTRGNKEHGLVDLEGEFGEINHASAFAHTTIRLERNLDTELVLGSDDGLKVRINGEWVFEDMGIRGWKPDQFRVPVSLKKGENEILCRIEEKTGSWEFSIQYVPGMNLMEKVEGQRE